MGNMVGCWLRAIRREVVPDEGGSLHWFLYRGINNFNTMWLKGNILLYGALIAPWTRRDPIESSFVAAGRG
jgi:hypothetical protein